MVPTRTVTLLLGMTLVLVACGAPPPTATKTSEPATDEPGVTLRLAVADAAGRSSEPYVLAFVELVNALSGGKMTVEPIWDAAVDLEPDFERGVITTVRDGSYDLGLAGSRAWDLEGVTAFQPLQAPFLIDNDALAEAVATSDIAKQMLDALSPAGFVGLTLWPEDLRHPFSVVPDKTLLSPDEFAGLDIRTIPSGMSFSLIEALGGNPVFVNNDYVYQGAESGLLQGFSLTGQPVATGNVVFFPKYQVLFANGAAFEQLIQSQQSILRKAAAAVQETAIANRLGEAEAAEAWCTDGGSIVMASEEQMAAFVEAAQPVFDQIQANPANAELVDAIQELKANVEPSPGAEACGAAATQPPSEAVEQNWSGELPPNGIWTTELTPEDYVRNGVRQSAANEWAGEFWYEFQDGQGGFRGEFLDGLVVCPFTYEAVENFMRITFVDDGNPNYNCGNEVHELQWRLDTEGLRFHVVAIHNGPRVENTAHYEARPWQKVEE